MTNGVFKNVKRFQIFLENNQYRTRYSCRIGVQGTGTRDQNDLKVVTYELERIPAYSSTNRKKGRKICPIQEKGTNYAALAGFENANEIQKLFEKPNFLNE